VNTKLTLRLDDKLIASAKRHSAESGRSISQLVADFFALIDTQGGDAEITPACARFEACSPAHVWTRATTAVTSKRSTGESALRHRCGA